MSAVEARVNTGLAAMNYVSLPSGAFDGAGNIVFPADFALPRGWSDTYGRITQSPDWDALQRMCSAFTVPGTDYSCWRVALSFYNGEFRLILIKYAGNLTRSEAVNWADNVWEMTAEMQGYAGRVKALPQVALDLLTRTGNAVRDSGYWDRPIPDGVKPGDSDEVAERKRREAQLKREQLQHRKWQVSGALAVIDHVLQFLGSLTRKSRVQCTVLWYQNNLSHVSGDRLDWPVMHRLYDAMNRRAIHYWWNSDWNAVRPPAYPFVYSTAVKRRGVGVTNVEHQPWDLAQRFYPLGSWPDLDRQLLEEEVRLGDEDQRRFEGAARAARCIRARNDDEGPAWRWHWECPPGTNIDDIRARSRAPRPARPYLTWPRQTATGLGTARAVVQVQPASSDDDIPHDPEEVVADSATTAPVAPSVVVHALPGAGNQIVGRGTLYDDIWTPDDEDEDRIPPIVWLPTLGRVAELDGSVLGWRLTAFLPYVVAVSTSSDPRQDASDDEALDDDTRDVVEVDSAESRFLRL